MHDRHGGAAVLVALRVIADDADAERVGRFKKKLPAQAELIAVVKVLTGDDVGDEAVAGFEKAVDAACENVLDDRAGDGAFRAVAVEIGAGVFRIAAEFIFRLLGAHDQRAGRRVPAESRALRAARDFDGVDLAEVAEGDRVARAVNVVDEDADGGLQAGVVADRATTTMLGERIESSRMSETPDLSSRSPEKAETAIGTS